VTRRLLFTYLSLAVVVLAALEIPLGVANARNERRTLTAKIERDATAVASLAESTLERDRTANLPAIRALAARYARDTGGRVVIVDRRGASLVDSSPAVPGERIFASRPEIATALRGDVAAGTRYSATLHQSLLFVAVPIASGGRILGAVRITYPTSTLDARVRRYWLVLAVISAIVLAVAAVLGASFAGWIRRPLRNLESAAAAVSGGDLKARAAVAGGPPELHALAGTFNDMVVKLEALLDSQREFVADASHELRTPLTALRLRLENLEAHVESGGRPGLDAAVTEIERLSLMVESLLVLARADASAAVATSIDLGEVARERIAAWTEAARAQDVELAFAGDVSAIARADADRLRQVLDNLLANALDVAPRGSTVAVLVDATSSTIVVRDEGPGLSDEEKRRAFDRFWRGRSTGGGSGLGLAIARRLLETDHASIMLRDGPGGGLEAVLRFVATR
jgi:signal transduction histidine kinase